MVHGEFIVCCKRESDTTNCTVVGSGSQLYLLRFSVHSSYRLENAMTSFFFLISHFKCCDWMFFFLSRLASDVTDVSCFRMGNVMTEGFHAFINPAWQILWLKFFLHSSILSGRCCGRHFMHSSMWLGEILRLRFIAHLWIPPGKCAGDFSAFLSLAWWMVWQDFRAFIHPAWQLQQ
jgi:hypothetical protein